MENQNKMLAKKATLSKVMKAAWVEFKKGLLTFSQSLKKAWFEFKNGVKRDWIAETIASAESRNWIAKLWQKKGNRLYINTDFLYNTKKCEQSAYIDLDTFEVKVFTNCPSQNWNWIKSQNDKVATKLAPLARLARIKKNS